MRRENQTERNWKQFFKQRIFVSNRNSPSSSLRFIFTEFHRFYRIFAINFSNRAIYMYGRRRDEDLVCGGVV
jgi:hypothetical protein